jgi:hypothetical protein
VGSVAPCRPLWATAGRGYHEVEDRADRARAAVDHAADGSGLPRQVERQVERVHLFAVPRAMRLCAVQLLAVR